MRLAPVPLGRAACAPDARAVRPAAAPAGARVTALDIAFGVIVIVLQNAAMILNPHGGDADAGSTGAQLLWGVVYVCAGAMFLRARGGAVLLRRSVPMLALIALVCASAAWSSDGSLTLRRAGGVLGTTLIAYAFAARFPLRTFLGIVAIALGLCLVLSYAFVLAAPALGVMQTEYAGAWRGVFAHKNVAAEALALGIVTMLVLWHAASARVRVALASGILLAAVFLAQTRSASGALAAVAGAAVVVLVTLWRAPRVRAGAIAASTAVAAACAALVPNWSVASQAIGRDATLTGRTDVWGVALQAIRDQPLLGYGYSAFWLPNGPVLSYIGADQGWQPYHAHNGFLQLALDAGLAGVALFVVALFQSLWAAVRMAARAPLAVASWPLAVIIAFVVLNGSDSLIAASNGFAWTAFVAAALYGVKQS